MSNLSYKTGPYVYISICVYAHTYILNMGRLTLQSEEEEQVEKNWGHTWV